MEGERRHSGKRRIFKIRLHIEKGEQATIAISGSGAMRLGRVHTSRDVPCGHDDNDDDDGRSGLEHEIGVLDAGDVKLR